MFTPLQPRQRNTSEAKAATPTAGWPALRVLEPRVLLDAAAVQTAQEIAAQTPPMPDGAHAPAHDGAHAELLAALASSAPAVSAAPATDDTPTGAKVLIFIDSRVAEPAALLAAIGGDAQVHRIGADQNGVDFIAQTLVGRSQVQSIHIVSHGSEAALALGNAALTAETMSGIYAAALQGMRAALAQDADILLYGCDFGAGERGAQAAQRLADLTGADVAASSDATGAVASGGDWELEVQRGTIETPALAAPEWAHLLAAPVLDATPALSYTALEDAAAPLNGTASGTLISAYTGGIADADPGAVKGIAITANAPAQGVWWYTLDGGANWQTVGTVSATSALLLADNANTRLHFQATTANFNGAVTGTALTFKAWDQSLGVAGTKASTTTTLLAATSSATDTVAVTVTPVNDAPVLTDVARALTAFNEDVNGAAPVGAVGVDVSLAALNINNANASDVDTGALKGIAIVGASSANGVWWYSIDNGATWAPFGSVSQGHALLLSNATASRIYFQSMADYNGTIGDALTIRAWDQTQGANGGYVNLSTNGTGGASAFSAATDTVVQTVSAVADISADSATTLEDTAIVIDVLANDSFENPGRAITAVGGQAIALGASVAVTNGTVTLIDDAGTQKLRFTPAADYNGSASFSYTVTSGGVGESATVTVTLTAVADAPRIDLDGSVAGANYSATLDQGAVAIGKLISVADPEGNNLSAMTVTIAAGYQPGADRLSVLSANGITTSFNAATGVLTLTGNTTLANYQAALGKVRFETTSTAVGTRTIAVSAVSGTAPTASNTATASFTLGDSDGDGLANAGDIDDDNDGLLDTVEDDVVVPSLVDGSMEGAAGVAWTEGTNTGSLNSSIAGTGWTPVSGSPDTWKGAFSLTGSGYWAGAMNGVPATAQGEVFAAIYNGFTAESMSIQIPVSAGVQVGDEVQISFNQIFGGVNGITTLGAQGRFTLTIDGVAYSADTLTYAGNVAKSWSKDTINFIATSTAPTIVVSITILSGGDGYYFGIDDFRAYTVASLAAAHDPDNDGVASRVDLDSDNDGITDNVEAQSSAGYAAPSGVDGDVDGLDDAYDAGVGNPASAASVGLLPVDADNDGTQDGLDGDSDNDGVADIVERGDGQPTSLTASTDTDGDGLLDIFEGANVNDGFDPNDQNILPGGIFNLADSDNDVADNGAGATPRSADFDYRDDPQAPLNQWPAAGWSLPEDAGGKLTGLSISDNSANGSYLVQLSVASGTLSATPGGGVAVTGSASGTLGLSGTLAAINAYLASAAAPSYTPVANATGPVNLQIVTRDGGGGAGSLSDTDNATITLTPVNDAPVVDATPALGYTALEDAGAPVNGTAVGQLVSTFTGAISDIDAGAVKGIAITAAAPSNGMWWYTTDGGASWQTVGPVSNTSALLLADNANTRLYFQATTLNFNGSGGAAALTLRGWDQTMGSAGSKVTTATNGGTTAFSSTTDTVAVTIAPVNDAPVLGDVVRTLTAFNEDSNIAAPVGAVGIDVSLAALNVNNANVSDVDSGAAKGIAIVGANAASGVWWFSANNGASWTQLGSVSEANALLLSNATTSRLYFQSTADYNGTVSDALTIRAWDQTQGSNGSYFNVSANGTGGTTAFSVATDTVAQTVTAVADIVANTTGNTTLEDTAIVIDVLANDTFENAGRMISAVDGQAISVGGTVAVTNGTVSLINDAGQPRLRFLPAADYNGSATFSYTVSSGGVAVVETANVTVAITAVADAPRIDLDGEAAGANHVASYDQGAVRIGNLISVSDPEGNNLVSMTIALAGATAADSLSLANPVSGISASYNVLTGVLTLSGNTTLANYQTAINNVRFETTSPAPGSRTLTVSAVSSVAPIASNIAVATLVAMDSDGDGIANAADIDDDNDGILDVVESARNDGVVARLDIDADNDGITDNVEAQATAGYVAPSGVDSDADGLDDAYDAAVGNKTAVASVGLTPVDTDRDGDPDGVDADADADGAADIVERGDGQPTNISSTTDTDGDGLLDIFEASNADDGFDANDENVAPGAAFNLADSDNDTTANGANAMPRSVDLDYRDNALPIAPIVDLNSGATPVQIIQNGSFLNGTTGWTKDAGWAMDPATLSQAGITGWNMGAAPSGAAQLSFNLAWDNNVGPPGRLTISIGGVAYAVFDGAAGSSGNDNTAVGTITFLNGATGSPATVQTSVSGTWTAPLVTINLPANIEPTGDLLFRYVEPFGASSDTYYVNNISALTTRGDKATDITPGVDFATAYTEGAPAVSIADTDNSVRDSDNLVMQSARIVLTNALAGDALVVGALPAGITAALDTSVAGKITVNLSGSASNAAYAEAIRAVGFRNSGDNPTNLSRIVEVSVNDGVLNSAVATTTIAVTPVNDPPNAVDYAASTNEDTPVVFDPRVNDTDPEGDALSITAIDGAALASGGSLAVTGGTVTLHADGTLTYAPATGFVGTASFSYTLSDGHGGTDIATVHMTVTEANDPPIAADDSNLVQANGMLDVAAIDGLLSNDLDGDPLAIIGFEVNGTTYAAGATAALAGVGTLTIQANGAYSFTPAADHGGPVPVVTYTVSDGHGSDTATLTLSINDLPVAVGDVATATEDTVLTVAAGSGLLANDSDADGDTLSVTGFTVNASSHAVGAPVTIAGVGVLTIDADGAYSFAPAANYSGAVPTVTYEISDGHGGTASATLDITLTPVNDAPVVNPDTLPDRIRADGENFNYDLSQYFADPDGDALNYVIAGLPPGRTYNPLTGVISGAIDHDASQGGVGGVYTVTVTVYDRPGATGASVTRSFHIHVINPTPTAHDDSAATDEDVAVDIQVLDNDVDPDSDPLTVTAASAGNGSVVIEADGTLRYTPNANYNGSDTISYTIGDGNGGVSSAQVTVTVAAVNDAPLARDDSGSVAEDATLQVATGAGLLANDSDVEGSALAITAFTVAGDATAYPAGSAAVIAGVGVLSIGADGAYTFAPLANYAGPVPVVRYTVSDGSATSTGTLALTIVPQADAPVATHDGGVVIEDSLLEVAAGVGLLSNDTDVDGDVLTISGFTVAGDAVVHAAGEAAVISGIGVLTIQTDGAYSFEPAANYVGVIPVATYTVSDGTSTTTATLTLVIVSENDAPEARNDTASTDEDATLDVAAASGLLANDVDVDGDTLTVTEFTVAGDATVYAAGDTASLANVGTLTIKADGAYTFTPVANHHGPGPIATYTVTDGTLTDTATLTITIVPVADAPVANADSGVLNEDATLDVAAGAGLLSNDSDADGDMLSVTGYSVAGNTYAAGNAAVLSGIGTLTLRADGSYSFVPVANYSGPVPVATYTVSDGSASATATLALTISSSSDAPVSETIPDRVRGDGESFDFAVGDYFSDPDGDTLNYVISGLPAGLGFNPATGAISGTLAADASQGGTGGAYTVMVTAHDGPGATGQSVSTTFQLTATNPAPTAANDSAITSEDLSVIIDVLANDVDPDGDALTVVSATAGHGTVLIHGDGTLSYAPAADYHGADTVTYTISDGQGSEATAQVTVDVGSVNDAPTAALIADQFNSDAQDLSGAASLDLSSYFQDVDGDTLRYAASGLPAGLSIDPATGVVSGTIAADASTGGAAGVHAVAVTASDGQGGAVTQRFNWQITNLPPMAFDDTLPGSSVGEDAASTSVAAGDGLLANDVDEDPLVVTAANGQPIAPGGSVSVTGASGGSFVVRSDGSYSFTPDASFQDLQAGESRVTSIAYTVDDNNGGTATATLTVMVTGSNDAPTADALPAVIRADGESLNADPLNMAGYFHDVEGDALTFDISGLPAGLVFDPATGLISGTLDHSASQGGADGVYAVTVRADDGQGGQVARSFSFTVTNPPPTAVDDAATTAEDTPIDIAVLGNDGDPDGDTLVLDPAFTPVAQHGSVTLNADGSLRYQPDSNFTGIDTIVYQVSDGEGGRRTAQVRVTVTAVNDAPVPVDPGVPNQEFDPASGNYAATTREDTAFAGQVSATDVDGDTLRYAAAQPTHGTVSLNESTGAYTYAPAPDYHGADSFVVTIGDGITTLQRTVTMTVTAVDDIAADTAATNEDTRVNIAVDANDSFEDGAHAVTAINGTSVAVDVPLAVANGVVTLRADGTLDFQPAADFHGATTFDYTVSAGGGAETASVTVNVSAVNDAPVVSSPLADQADVDGAVVLGIDTASHFADADGDTLRYAATGLPAGLRIDAATGVISGTLASSASQAGADGVHAVTVTASDGRGGAVSSVFSFSVTNPAPLASNDSASTLEDSSVVIDVLGNDSDPDGDALGVTTASAVNGTVLINANGALTYTPNADFNGLDTIAYTLGDGEGGSATATVSVTVGAVNDPPVPQDPGTPGQRFDPATGGYAASTAEDMPFNGQVSDTDVDGDTLKYTAGTPAHGSVTIDEASGAYTYTPAADYHGADSFVVTIDDGSATLQSTVTMTVTAVADIAADAAATDEDTPVNIAVDANDSFEDSARAVSAIDGSAAVAGMPVAVANGSVTLQSDGTLDFQPAADFHGTTSFSYTVSAGGVSETSTVTVNVRAVNDAPVPSDPAGGSHAATTNEDTAFAGQVSATDVDGDTLRYTVTQPTHGSVSINDATGAYTYTPAADYHGADSFVVTVSDGATTVQRTVTMSVMAVADIAADAATTDEGTTVNIAVDANDSFEDIGHSVTAINGMAAAVDVPVTVANGSVTLRADGTLDFQPAVDFVGFARFDYTVSAGGVAETASVSVNVRAPEEVPQTVEPAMPSRIDVPTPPVVPVAVLAQRDDYPFVYLPAETGPAPTPVPAGEIRYVEPIVVTVVDAVASLRGTLDLAGVDGGEGVVLQAVNGIDALGGTRALGQRGVVLAAVNGVDSLRSVDVHQQDQTGHGLNGAPPAFAASLSLGDGVQLTLDGQGQHAWMAVNAEGGVREVRITLADGRPLPDWARVDANGFLVVEAPAGTELLRLRITVVPEQGAIRSHTVDVDLNAGELRPGARGQVQSPIGQGSVKAMDFETQLQRASRGSAAAEAQLLALLN